MTAQASIISMYQQLDTSILSHARSMLFLPTIDR